MIFSHSRFQIWNANQHPYKHTLSDFLYNNPAIPGVTNVQSALDYITAVLYPQSKAAVADVASLPTIGNTINDMRVVTDDGDGKAAAYRWEQREGDVAAKWYKIYDLDWGTDSILQGFLLKTQDIYVKQWGYNDLDSSGVAIVGTLAGQSIYGGATASTNLTLFANSGDGVGADTGYVQFGDNVRPITNNTYSFGTTAERWLKVWSTEVQAGTLNLLGGSITDSSGAISFDNENLSTTGTLTVASTVLSAATITNTTGTISFDNENLTTTGNLTANKLTATGAASSLATGTTIGTLTLASGSITDSGGAISFDNENLTTTGTFSALTVTGTTSVTGGNLSLSAQTLASTNANGNILIVPNGSGIVDIQKAMTTIGQTVTGVLSVTGQLNADNLRLDGNTLSSTDVNGNISLSPNGTGLVDISCLIRPTTDNARDLGDSTHRFRTLYFGTSLHNGTLAITAGEVFALKNNLFRDAARTQAVQTGDALFYDAVSGTWLASAPDTEITHSGLSGLTTGDSGHTQFALLAGRAGGQSLVGGTAASELLNLESTAHATKGFVQTKDTFRAFTDASYSGGWSGADLGGSGNRFRHLYTAGEAFGLRLENVGALPSPSTQNVGRMVYYTPDADIYTDTGTTFKRLNYNRSQTDTSWNGTDTTKNVTVSDVDARQAIWQLSDNTNDFEQVYCSIKATSATNVLITATAVLPAGTYRLIGIE